MADDSISVSMKQQMEEIIGSADRPFAYASLLHLQRRSAEDPSSMAALSVSSPPLLPIILSDIQTHDEEIAALALKCLGFMLYHPSLVPIFSASAESVLELLSEMITGTRMKAVCNLGVWCISVQQLDVAAVGCRLDLLVMALVHALNNPFGSLSTTFEAIQALTKLATQFGEKMRGISNIWVPPVYRRLVSNDKKERDMAERCLLKIKSMLYPPPLVLSQAVRSDLDKKLLPSMLHMFLDNPQKVHMIRAWGWYISLLGTILLKNRHLINKMLKLPEQTFSDPDRQVQIASLVAWEHLVNVLLPTQKIDLETNSCDQVTSLLKTIKILLMPLKGIILSKCDISVRLFGLKIWHHLLYKLNLSVNHPSVIMTSFWPIVEAVFSQGPCDNQSISIWRSCLDLLDDYIMSKVKVGEMEQASERSPLSLVDKSVVGEPFVDNKGSSKENPINWLPWKISNLDFHLKIVRIILSHAYVASVTSENRKLAFNSALRIFRSVLRGVQIEVKIFPTQYENIQLCITTITKFIKEACEEIVLEHCVNQFNYFYWEALQFVDAVKEELDSSMLASPLYHVSLDLKYIKDMQSSENTVYMKIETLPVVSLLYMKLVSPVVYITILHLCLTAHCIQNLLISETDIIPCSMQNSRFLLFSSDRILNLHAAISFLYMQLGKSVNERSCWLIMWITIAKELKDLTNVGLSFSENEPESADYTLVYWFLSYPLAMLLNPMFSVPESVGSCSDVCLVSSYREIEMERVIEVWRSLFDSLCCGSKNKSSLNYHTECMSQMLIRVLDGNTATVMQDYTESSFGKFHKNGFVSVFGDLVICLLRHTAVLNAVPTGSEIVSQVDGGQYQCSPIINCSRLAARFLELAMKVAEINPQVNHVVICRFYTSMTCLVGRISSKKDILLLMESIGGPLIQWLPWCASLSEETRERSNASYQLQCLWVQILECLQRCQPAIIFDSVFLGVQASLLQASLAHSYSPIADSTIAFWRATYGQNVNLHYPQCLLPVLDKLPRGERMSLQRENPLNNVSDGSSVENGTGLSQKRISRVYMAKESDTKSVFVDIVTVGSRNKRLKMAEHPRESKEVESRRVYCHGMPDCSKGKQELKKVDYIMKMLRKDT